MTVRRVAVKGRGTVELPAYGVSDAEHQVEKELLRAWPDAQVSVVDVARTEEGRRIVEEFAVRYRLSATVEVEAEGDDDARRAAFRSIRERLRSTRYASVVLEPG